MSELREPNIVVSWVSAEDAGGDTAYYSVCLYDGGAHEPVDSCTVDDLESPPTPHIDGDLLKGPISELCAEYGLDASEVPVEYDC